MINDEYLFKYRNKEYGAYKIRKLYKKTILFSLFISAFIIITIFVIPLFLSFKNQMKDDLVFKRTIIPAELNQFENIEQPKPQELKPIKSKTPEIIPIKSNIDESIKTDTAKNKLLSNASSDDSIKKSLVHKKKFEDQRLKEEAQFSCGGDMLKFRNWFYQNFRYPDSLKNKNIQGKLLIQFTIDTRGLVDSVNIVNGVYPSIDNLAKQTILNAPRWMPCIVNGRKVKQLYIFPIYILVRR